MIIGTLLIIFSIYYLYKLITQKPDKVNYQEHREAIRKLPNFKLKGKQPSGKVEAFLYGKGYCIDIFEYRDGILHISLQNGKSFRDKLDKYSFYFSKDKASNIHINITANGKSTEIIMYEFLFSHEEWDLIANTMLCAGRTYNREILGSRFSGMSKAQAAMSVANIAYKLFG